MYTYVYHSSLDKLFLHLLLCFWWVERAQGRSAHELHASSYILYIAVHFYFIQQVINKITSGGLDYCFECFGLASLVQQAYASC